MKSLVLLRVQHAFLPAVHQHDDFVSFAILSLVPSPDGKYLGAATDTSRNIIFEAKSSKIVRDLYGK